MQEARCTEMMRARSSGRAADYLHTNCTLHGWQNGVLPFQLEHANLTQSLLSQGKWAPERIQQSGLKCRCQYDRDAIRPRGNEGKHARARLWQKLVLVYVFLEFIKDLEKSEC